MPNKRYLVRFLLVTAALLAAGIVWADTTAANSKTLQARNTVEYFCKIEFEGDREPKRVNVIHYSDKMAAIRQKTRDPLPLYSIFFDQDPLFVVASYKILGVQVRGNHATAKIEYRRIARSIGIIQDTWHLIAEPPHDDTVTLNLVFKKNQWWVIDPPPPRVSKEALIRYYEATIKNLGVENDPRWQKERDTLKLLNGLP